MSDLHERAMALLHEAAGIEQDGLASLLGWIRERREVETVQRREIERLLTEVRDLKARLKAIRSGTCFHEHADDALEWHEVLIKRATDLRRKGWRKP